MAENVLTQNEIFQLVGNYPATPEKKTDPVGNGLTPDDEFPILKKNIRKYGVVKTAESAGEYGDRGIRCALELAAAGFDAVLAKDLLVTAILAGKESDFKSQLKFNKAVRNLVFCRSEITKD